jgi:hypothetical protein
MLTTLVGLIGVHRGFRCNWFSPVTQSTSHTSAKWANRRDDWRGREIEMSLFREHEFNYWFTFAACIASNSMKFLLLFILNGWRIIDDELSSTFSGWARAHNSNRKLLKQSIVNIKISSKQSRWKITLLISNNSGSNRNLGENRKRGKHRAARQKQIVTLKLVRISDVVHLANSRGWRRIIQYLSDYVK